MTDSCWCPPEAGNSVCDLPAQNLGAPAGSLNGCPECGKTGKPVGTQTVKALLSITLRKVQETNYLFCRTPTCPIVYFVADGKQTFLAQEVRERVFQKEPDAEAVLVCYCFHHTVGTLRAASQEGRKAIIEDINIGISTGQCACNLRNPQGFCCLGNVRAMTKRLEKPTYTTT